MNQTANHFVNQLLLTDKPVEFEKQLAKVPHCSKIIGHFRGMDTKISHINKENP